MFSLPLLTFFGVKMVLEDNYEVKPPWNLLGPAIAAVVVVNAVIILYVYKAFREAKKEEPAEDKKRE